MNEGEKLGEFTRLMLKWVGDIRPGVEKKTKSFFPVGKKNLLVPLCSTVGKWQQWKKINNKGGRAIIGPRM